MPPRKGKLSKVKRSGKSDPLTEKKRLSHSEEQTRASKPSVFGKQISIELLPRVCLWHWDLKTNQLWLSENFNTLFGITKKKFIGSYESLLKTLTHDYKKIVPDEISKCLESDKEYVVQHQISKAGKIPKWIEVAAKVLRDRKGNAVSMMGSLHDITEIKLNEIARKEWEARYKLITTASNLIIYDYDLISGKIEWNGTIEEVLGYKSTDLNTIEKWEKLIHREDRKNAWTQLELVKEGLRMYDVQYRFKKKSRGYVNIHDKGIFLLNDSGQPYRMLGTMLDISEKIRIEKDLVESNKFKESLENAMPGMLYVYDLKKHENIYVNHNITRTLGYSWEEMEIMGGDITRALVHPDDIIRLSSWANEPSRTVKDSEYRLQAKNGDWRWFYSREAVFQRDDKGYVTQIIGVAQDITTRKKTEEELKESEQRFRTLQEASFGGIGLHDKGIIIDCNQGLSDITGYTREELLGSDGLNLIAPEYRELVMHNILSGYEKPYDVDGIYKDGTRYSLEICGKNIPYKGRNIRVTEFRNISNRKVIEQKILEQNAKLQAITIDLKRKNDQLEEFTQIVSHNLRSPMGNIVTLLTFMEGSSSEEDKEQFMKYLKESASNALTTLDELNEVLKVKQNKSIEKQVLNFEKVFEQVKSMIRAKIAETSAEIHVDFSQAPTLFYPHIYLESIFLNLLTNALKYHKPDEKPVIDVRTYKDKKDVILEIKDNGLGINLERYGHQIFRLQKTFHKHPESRGIGLFMIKNQIEAMGGEINIRSSENVGTTFIINFNKHHSNED